MIPETLSVGIDIGKHHHEAAFLDSAGKPVTKPLRFRNSWEGYHQLKARLKQQQGKVQIALEATGHYGHALHYHLINDGFPVVLFNPLQTHAFLNTSVRGSKTDRMDAHRIAALLRQEQPCPTPLPTDSLIALKELTRFRRHLSETLAQEKTRLLSLLDRLFPDYVSLFRDPCSKASLTLLKAYPLPQQIAALELNQLHLLLKEASRGRVKRERCQALQERAACAFNRPLGQQALVLELGLTIQGIESLQERINTLNREIHSLFEEQNTPLSTIPGIGEVLGPTILGELGDIAKFSKAKNPAKAVVAFSGVDPKPDGSGQREGYRRISKRGSKYLRTALHQAAFCAYHKDPLLQGIYERQIALGKKHRKALNAVANKLCHIIYACLRDNRPYKCPLATG